MIQTNNIPLAKERRRCILDQLEQLGSVRVATLASQFQVAEETIRRDLDKLSDEGCLSRTHGGALSIRSENFDLPQATRKAKQAAEKRAIASFALSLINENDVIALDASTTALELASQLPDMPLTVITNGIDAARILFDRTQIQVISTGGELDSQSICLLGPIAEATFAQFSINTAFCSCKGIDLERGYSEATTAHSALKRLMIGLADKSCLMADRTKLGVRSAVYSGGLDSVDRVITDAEVSEPYHDAFAEADVVLNIAPAVSS